MKSVIALFGIFAVVACGTENNSLSTLKERWNPANNPLHLGNDFVRDVNKLPVEGRLEEENHPWSDDYWPSSRGGIAARWNNVFEDGFEYSLKSLEEVKKMSREERATLSPAEKYDLFMGRYDYPLVNSERLRTSKESPSWEGLCHGWASAALLYAEPRPKSVRNPDGVELSFGSSDIKALLSYFQGQEANGRVRFLGSRCNSTGPQPLRAMRRPECRDVNAGSFHIVLTNMIGIKKQGFVMDKNRYLEVWNHPVFAFKIVLGSARPPSPGAAPNAVSERTVQAEVSYASEISPEWKPVLGTFKQLDSKETYNYRIELDKNENIVGGEWISDHRPDFLWTQEKEKFSGYYRGLGELVSVRR